MPDTLLDKISRYSNNTTITDAWSSGQVGEIVDLKGDYIYRFIDYDEDKGQVYSKHPTDEAKLSCPVVATGIVGYWLHHKDNLGLKEIFESYYEYRFKEYERAHQADADIWSRDIKKEFLYNHHIPTEKKCIQASAAINAYITPSDKEKIQTITANYLKFVRATRKTHYPLKHPQNRIIEDTFLDAYRMGGPACECVMWMRTEYNLPPMGPHWHTGDKTEKERLTGKWKKYHEEYIPQYVQEGYEDFDESVLMYTHGGLMEEINENLRHCTTPDDRTRYIITLLQPFKDFAAPFYPKERIDERKASIIEHQQWIEDYKEIPDDAKDQRTGNPIEPQKQIAACLSTIRKYEKDIDYYQKVQDEFYWFAQHGLTGEFSPDENQEMGQYLGRWWSIMITFARRLAALTLTYGIKLTDVQELCKVYLISHFNITDYVDYQYISSTQHARTLLNKIEESQRKSPKEIIFTSHKEFDAWHYISNLIRSAQTRIIIVDGYADDRVLNLLTKKRTGVKAILYSRYRAALKDDIEKYNKQYDPVEYIQFPDKIHDRFLIIDEKVYHLGASIKDMGNSLTAITYMDTTPQKILEELSR